MNVLLLILSSLVTAPLQNAISAQPGGTNCACQQPAMTNSCACQGGGAAGMGMGGGAWSNSPAVNGLYGPSGMSGGYGDGYGDGYGAGGYGNNCRGRGRCRTCCKDSTCNMYQHYPYLPDNYGYYYFRPYNYPMVWKHQQWIAQIGGDPRNPYSRAMFIPVYEQFENTTYEPDRKPSSTLSPLPNVSKALPELEQLLKKPDMEMPPTAAPAEPTPAAPEPAPQNN